MVILEVVLVTATLLCSLVAGFVFAFAVVVMPGIKNLKDAEFIRAFQVMDGVIQNNQPLFILVWMGSTLTLVIAAVLGLFEFTGVRRALLVIAAAIHVLVVQLPTIRINIPLNNKLQRFDVDTTSEREQQLARSEFEPQWNRWNNIRTFFASVVSLLLIILLLQP